MLPYFENRVGFFFAPRTLNTLLNRCLLSHFSLKKSTMVVFSIFFKKVVICHFCCKFVLKYISSFLQRKEMLIYFKRCCVDIIYRLLKQKKETKKLQKNNCCWYIETKLVIFFMLCICILLLPKYIVRCNFCVGIYFFHFNNEETCYFILRHAVWM